MVAHTFSFSNASLNGRPGRVGAATTGPLADVESDMFEYGAQELRTVVDECVRMIVVLEDVVSRRRQVAGAATSDIHAQTIRLFSEPSNLRHD